MTFQYQLLQGIPTELPPVKPYDTKRNAELAMQTQINHAPKRKEILTKEEQTCAQKSSKIIGIIKMVK